MMGRKDKPKPMMILTCGVCLCNVPLPHLGNARVQGIFRLWCPKQRLQNKQKHIERGSANVGA